jgi:hypothetical protein
VKVPRHWAKTDGSATDPAGKRYQLEVWGGSEESAADALAAARRRLGEIVSRLARGEPPDRYLYGTRHLREEILRTLGEVGTRSHALVTRNRYGAEVLNTAQVPFVDVDAPPVGAGARLRRLFRREPAADPVLDRIREACARRSRHGFRIYRTPAGYRVLATDLFLDPTAPAARELLADFGADPRFVKLCGLQGSFRARLTPKPWRCGAPLPPGRHPREGDDAQRRFASWLAKYESRAADFGACRYLESAGPERGTPEAHAIVEEHDRACRALAELPLA